MCRSMADIKSPTAEIRRGKKRRKIERNYRAKIQWSALLHRATIKKKKKKKKKKQDENIYGLPIT